MRIFDAMELRVDIGFDQLVKAVKRLPKKQLNVLLSEVSKPSRSDAKNEHLKALLLSGPTLTGKQLETIQKTREALTKWRNQ
jgi:hypothetical protein